MSNSLKTQAKAPVPVAKEAQTKDKRAKPDFEVIRVEGCMSSMNTNGG